MSTPEALIAAIRDRINANTEKMTIKEEALNAGHSEEVFEAAYALAVASKTEAGLTLPRSYELWKSGWLFALNEWKLILAMAVPLAIFGVLDLLIAEGRLALSYVVASPFLGLFSIIVYMLGMLVVLRQLSNPSSSYRAALTWAKNNFWSFVIVYALVALTILGGYLLLIIPGVIATVTLYFSIYALAFDGIKKEAALVRSRELVKGKWWKLVRKLVGVGIYNFLIILSLMIVGAIVSLLFSSGLSEVTNASIYVAVSQVVGVAIAIVMAAVGARLYESFKGFETESTEEVKKGGYRFMGALGLLIFIGIILGTAFFAMNPQYLEAELEALSGNDTNIPIDTIVNQAESFRALNENSYEGLCVHLTTEESITSDDECNATPTSYAVRIVTNEGGVCIDNSGYQKSLNASLNERIECLPL